MKEEITDESPSVAARTPAYVVFDTETTGLFDFKAPADAPGQPRLASIAMIVTDERGETISAAKHYVKPDGWEMPAEAGEVNGLTTEFLTENGIPIGDVLDIYQGHIEAGLPIVAFNAQFDTKMMRAEFRRAQRDDLFDRTPNICVMRGLQLYAKDGLCCPRGFIKLSAACEWFGIENPNAHDAMSDAEAARQLLARLIADGRLADPKVHLAKVRPA